MKTFRKMVALFLLVGYVFVMVMHIMVAINVNMWMLLATVPMGIVCAWAIHEIWAYKED